MNFGCIIFQQLVSLLNCNLSFMLGCIIKSAISGQFEDSLALHVRLHHVSSGGKGWEHPVFLKNYLAKLSLPAPIISEAFNPSYSCIFGAMLEC